MDFEEENMCARDMMERIAQLDHSKSLLRDQNTEMRIWLDAADEDMALLRAENNHLKKQVKDLVKTVLDAQSVESEATACLPDYPDLKVRNEMKIQILEKESAFLQEENQTLTDELESQTQIRNLLQLQETDDVTLSKLKVSLQTLESELEGAQLGLQQRDEVIHQKHQELKHAKELVDEYSTIIKDLRLKNQELKEELEAGQDELTFAGAVDLLEASENRRSPALSFAEELRQLSSSAQANISKSEDTQTNGEVMSEKVQKSNCLVKYGYYDRTEQDASDTSAMEMKLQAFPDVGSSKRYKCVGLLITVLLLGTLSLFLALAFITSGRFLIISKLFSLNSFWSSVWFVLEPYCTLQYGGTPPT